MRLFSKAIDVFLVFLVTSVVVPPLFLVTRQAWDISKEASAVKSVQEIERTASVVVTLKGEERKERDLGKGVMYLILVEATYVFDSSAESSIQNFSDGKAIILPPLVLQELRISQKESYPFKRDSLGNMVKLDGETAPPSVAEKYLLKTNALCLSARQKAKEGMATHLKESGHDFRVESTQNCVESKNVKTFLDRLRAPKA